MSGGPQFDSLLSDPYATQTRDGVAMRQSLSHPHAESVHNFFKGNLEKTAHRMTDDPLGFAMGFAGSTLPIKTAKSILKIDNPGGRWLEEELARASRRRKEAGNNYTVSGTLGGTGGVTGYYPKYLNLDPNILSKFDGAMGEQFHRASGDKLKSLQKSISKEGYKPSPILVLVREDGKPFIVEGNTRVAEAMISGRKTIPVELKYLRGAEDVPGPLNPDKLVNFD